TKKESMGRMGRRSRKYRGGRAPARAQPGHLRPGRGPYNGGLRPAMLSRFKPSLRYPVEFSWLLGLVFFLPLFEAPKNLCWLGYVLAWLYNRARDRSWGGAWDRWDSLIAVWIASGYLSAAFAGVHHD